MASDLVAKAKEAFIDDHFDLAVDLYSQAIAITPNNAQLFADRAQANIKLHNFTGNLFTFFSLHSHYIGNTDKHRHTLFFFFFWFVSLRHAFCSKYLC